MIPNFDFEKWLKRRLMPSNRHNAPEKHGTLTIPLQTLITDLTYDYNAATKVGQRKAEATAKRYFKNCHLLSIDEKGYFLKELPRVKFDEYWRVVPYTD